MRFKTFTPSEPAIQRKWYVVDATGINLGRLASRIAHILRGKHKPSFVPNMDTGDFVIVLNAGKITVTGDRMVTKFYRRHSQYPGGFKEVSLKDQLATFPERVIEAAVRGMLPHNRLGRQMFKKLKVFRGTEHPHSAQKPEILDIETVNVTEKVIFTKQLPTEAAKVTHSTKASRGEANVAPVAPKVQSVAPKAAAPVAKPAKAPKAAVAGQDNLTRIEGIGPKVAQALYDSGVTTFAQLATLTAEALTKMVKEDKGVRIVGDAATWPKQAKFIVDGDDAGLKTYQDLLVGGREPNA